MCYIAAKHEIVEIYNTEKNTLGKKRTKVSRLDEIIAEAKERITLSCDLKVNKSLIRQRLKRKMCVYASQGGHTSPLTSIEPDILRTLAQMARIRQCLSPLQVKYLINIMIKRIDV